MASPMSRVPALPPRSLVRCLPSVTILSIAACIRLAAAVAFGSPCLRPRTGSGIGGEAAQGFEQQADGSGSADGGAGAAQLVAEENRVQASGGGHDRAIQGPQSLRGCAVEWKRKIAEIAPVVRQVGAGDEDGAVVQQPAQGLCGGSELPGGETADVKWHERGVGNEGLQKGYLDLHGMVAGGRLGYGVEWR